MSAAFVADDKQILSAGGVRDGTIRSWDVETGKQARSFSRGYEGTSCLAISPDGKRLLSGGWDKSMSLWDVETATWLAAFAHAEVLTSIAYSRDGRHALSASSDGVIRLWDIDTRRELYCIRPHLQRVYRVQFFADGRRAISCGDDAIKIWDLPLTFKSGAS